MRGGIDHPQNRDEYISGLMARQRNLGKNYCPCGLAMMLEKHLWLAGWIDKDIEMQRRNRA
ncbi:hypothetical protein D3C78_1976990 [compost metagenome]